jgi:phosphoribosylamine--glycine ligase
LEYVAEKQGDLVIKFDGLAGGKGVFVCSSIDEATDALRQLSDKYGQHVDFIIEDKISGDEVSIIGFTDGKTIKTLLPSQDHKQLNDGDLGPNTGGMGAFCPVEVDEKIMKNIQETIIEPTLKGIQKEKMNYKGVLYFGIMVKEGKGYLLEYNVRFGDPETEVLLPSLKTSLVNMVDACLNQELSKIKLEFHPGYFVDVVLASGGYPKAYKTGKIIKGLDQVDKDILVFHAGTKKENSHILTNGGRVLNIVAQADSLEQSRKKVYNVVDKIHFENSYYRKDISLRTNKHLKS